MRINVYVAQSTGLSRRQADKLIANGKVTINNQLASPGDLVDDQDIISLNDQPIKPIELQLVLLNKPVNHVVSRNGQGAKTIYDILPHSLAKLKPVGRLDKDSSGLLLLTNDGKLAQRLSHPSYNKTKVYNLTLNKPLKDEDRISISLGVNLEDGISRLKISNLTQDRCSLTVTMSEGRNRQIRRTFQKLGYQVIGLHRVSFGDYSINQLKPGQWESIPIK